MQRLLIIVFLCSLIKVEAQTSTFSRIDSLVQIGRYKIALNELGKKPSTFDSNKKIASIYDALDNHKKASEYYEKALKLKSDYLTKIKLGKSYKKQKKLVKAITVFEEITNQDPENLLVQYELGKLYLQTKKSEKAQKVFKNLISNDPMNANYSYQLGLVYAQLRKRNLKINNFLNAFRKDSTHIKSIINLAKEFTKLRDKDSASIFIAKGLSVNPNNIDLNKLKINNLYRDKKYKEAVALLRRIDSLEPNNHYTQKMLGKAYYNLIEYEKAKKYLKRAAKLDNEDFKAYTYLGHISLKEKDISNAMYNYGTATFVGKKPRDKEHLGLAKVYYEKKLPKRVIEQYKKAVEENHKNSTALYLLATFSDEYYKDKKIAYNLYKRYLDRFENKNKEHTNFVAQRIKEIKKLSFLKGEELE